MTLPYIPPPTPDPVELQVSLLYPDGSVVDIEDYQSLSYVLVLNDVSDLTLVIPNSDIPNTLPYTAQVRVRLWHQDTWRDEWRGYLDGLEANGDESGVQTWTLRAQDLLAYMLQRPARPANLSPNTIPAYAPDVYTGVAADAIIKAIARRATDAGPWIVPGLTVDSNRNQGNILDHKTDFSQDALTAVQELARAGGVDFGIRWIDGLPRFETGWPFWGVDRSAGNSAGNDPVILSEDLSSLGPWQWSLNWRGMKNYLITLGKDALDAPLAEVFQDATDQVNFGFRPGDHQTGRDAPYLRTEGKAELNRLSRPEESYSYTPVDVGPYTYPEHFELGDLVTVQIPVRQGRTLTRQIERITVSATPQSIDIRPEIGTSADPQVRFRDRLRRLQRRIRRAEEGGL